MRIQKRRTLWHRAKHLVHRGLVEMANARLLPFLGKLERSPCGPDKRSQNESKHNPGANVYEALYSDRPVCDSLLARLTGISWGRRGDSRRKFPWKDFGTFVECRRAQGRLGPCTIARRTRI